jgi:GT2 family glycosyltransferase
MIYGCVRPASTSGDDGELTPFIEIEEPERLSRSDGFRVVGMSANFAARRRLFESIGAFDENLGCGGPLPGGEDFDLAYRTYRSGSVIMLRPDIAVLHDGRRERSEWPNLIRDYGIGDGAFYSKHVRCGDPYALFLLSQRLVNMGSRVIAKRVLRRPGHEHLYVRGVLSGVRHGLKLKVDRTARRYVTP